MCLGSDDFVCVCVCVCSNSRNDVPRVAQQYGTIAAHTRRRASVRSVLRTYVQFYRFDKADATADVQGHCNHRPPLLYHYFQLRAHWVRISWSIGSEKSFEHVPPVGVEPSTSCVQGDYPIH